MNIVNAIGFLLLGTVMQVLPFVAPSTSATLASGPSTSDLWLHLMGGVTGVIGGGYLARQAVREVSAAVARISVRSAKTVRALKPARESVPLDGVQVSF